MSTSDLSRALESAECAALNASAALGHARRGDFADDRVSVACARYVRATGDAIGRAVRALDAIGADACPADLDLLRRVAACGPRAETVARALAADLGALVDDVAPTARARFRGAAARAARAADYVAGCVVVALSATGDASLAAGQDARAARQVAVDAAWGDAAWGDAPDASTADPRAVLVTELDRDAFTAEMLARSGRHYPNAHKRDAVAALLRLAHLVAADLLPPDDARDAAGSVFRTLAEVR